MLEKNSPRPCISVDVWGNMADTHVEVTPNLPGRKLAWKEASGCRGDENVFKVTEWVPGKGGDRIYNSTWILFRAFFPMFSPAQYNTAPLLLQPVSSNRSLVSLAKMDWSTEQQPFYQGSPSRWLWESENQSTVFPLESFESGPSLTQPLPTERQRKSGLKPVSHMLVWCRPRSSHHDKREEEKLFLKDTWGHSCPFTLTKRARGPEACLWLIPCSHTHVYCFVPSEPKRTSLCHSQSSLNCIHC